MYEHLCFCQLFRYYPLTFHVDFTADSTVSALITPANCSTSRSDIELPSPKDQQSRQVCFTVGVFEAGACGERGEFAHLRPLIYPDADLLVLCFSLVRPDSLNSVTERVCAAIVQIIA